MNDSKGFESSRQPALDDELVPLSVAATVAYFHLVSARAPEKSLGEALKQVAFALAMVAPIHGAANGDGKEELGPREAERALFRGLDGVAVDLDGFAIRRADLRAAIAALKKAGVAEF
jgi:hypothetical protein